MHLGQHLLIYVLKPLTHFYKEFENADLACGFSVTTASYDIIILKNPKQNNSLISKICKRQIQTYTLSSL